MKHIHSILFECNAYRGEASHERCKAVEEHVAGCVGPACRIDSTTMRENDMGGGVVQPTLEIVYTRGDYKELIPKVDKALLDIGVVAFKALVSRVASYAAEAAIAGVGAGALAGGAAAGGRSTTTSAVHLPRLPACLSGPPPGSPRKRWPKRRWHTASPSRGQASGTSRASPGSSTYNERKRRGAIHIAACVASHSWSFPAQTRY